MARFFHSVLLDSAKCKGCINCIKRCPTQAIRVRNGKAQIISERCIDCGECIRVCPYHAKKAHTDPLERVWDYKYRIALPAPALYGQFNNLDDVDYILTAFKKMGFDDVFEVSRGAELVSEATRLMMNRRKLKRPVISSACPAVCRLIRVRFPELCDNILPLNAPMEEAARLARIEAREKTGLKDEEIGIFFISPCPAKVTDIKAPTGQVKSSIDGAPAISDLYPRLVQYMDKIKTPECLSKTGIIGVSRAGIGGESAALLKERYLAADGIENVINVLEEVEDDKLNDLDFIELNACSGGCVGGALTVANPYVARARIQGLRKFLPVSCNHLEDENNFPKEMLWSKPLEELPVMKLADNIRDAMVLMHRIDEITEKLPGIDCGTCGAPSCHALAEDIVREVATQEDCIFFIRDKLEKKEEKDLMPAPFRKERDKEG